MVKLYALSVDMPVVDQLNILNELMPILDDPTARNFLATKYAKGLGAVDERLATIRGYVALCAVAEDEDADRARELRESSELAQKVEVHVRFGRAQVTRMVKQLAEDGEGGESRALRNSFGFGTRLRPDRHAEAAALLARHGRAYARYEATLKSMGMSEAFMQQGRDLLAALPQQTDELIAESAEAEEAVAARERQEAAAIAAVNSLLDTAELYAAELPALAQRLESALNKHAAILAPPLAV